MRTSSRTNSGLPSVDAGKPLDELARERAARAARPRAPRWRAQSRPSSATHVGDPPARLGERGPQLAQLRAGEARRAARGTSVTHSARCSRRSSSFGSAHWMSSITTTSGRVGRERLDDPPDRPERLLHRPGRRRADARRRARRPRGRGRRRRRGAARRCARACSRRSSASASSRPAASRIRSAIGANVDAAGAVAADLERRRARRRRSGRGRARATGGSCRGRASPAPSRAPRPRRCAARSNAATQAVHLGVATDERRDRLGRGGLARRDLVGPDRLRATGDRHLAERLVRELAAGDAPRLVADEHVARAGTPSRGAPRR